MSRASRIVDSPTSKIEPYLKGLGCMEHALEPAQIAKLGWNLLREDLSLPCAVLDRERLLHNANWMRQFITAYGAKLAPHGKTTMAPKLFHLQLEAGAWGITLATAPQTMVAYRHGVRRVLMANQLIGKQNMAIIARLLEDPAFEYFCLVDSAPQVDQLGTFFRSQGQRLNVLLELGVEGGRTGVRNSDQLDATVAALARWREHLSLSGVEIYEGVMEEEAVIRGLIDRAVTITRDLAQQKKFDRNPIVLSGAGSVWYDVVAEGFSNMGLNEAVDIILRPGCYLTHDAGVCRVAQGKIEARNRIAHEMQTTLMPALRVWAYVQSIPEGAKAIVGLGKRDASFDIGFPIPALTYRPGDPAPKPAPGNWKVIKMMDQHAYMEIAPADPIAVGDMIGLDISHPCLTFDRWRTLPVIDTNYDVVDIVETFF